MVEKKTISPKLITLSLMLALLSAFLNPEFSKNSMSLPEKNFLFNEKVNYSPNFREASINEPILDEPKDKEKRFSKNPTRREVYKEMLKTGAKYGIPPEILYAIAFAESEFKQFNNNGTPFVSFDNGIGIMQVTPSKDQLPFDTKRAKYDYKYNIEIAARILKEKWNDQNRYVVKNGRSGNFLPILGDKDPMVLENWYFALWAYNGYAGENNPNALPLYMKDFDYLKKTAYQDRVINLAAKELGIRITKLSKHLLPSEHLPKIGSYYETPKPMHYSIISRETLEVDLRHNLAQAFKFSGENQF